MRDTQSPTISDALALFELDARARRLTPKTIAFYQWQLPAFAAWCEERGVTRLADITPALLRAYLVHLQDRGLAAHTVHGAAQALRAWLNVCVREELIATSPFARVQMPKLDKRILPALEPKDVKRLLAACLSERDKAALLFLVDTGLRASEFVQLNGTDVDLHLGTVRVRLGKGRKDRMTYFGGRAAKALARYYMRAGTPGDDGPVWRSENDGERLTTSGLRHALRRISLRAGMKTISPHMLRRTFALWSLRSGMSVYHLQRLMGHEDLTTLRKYLALVEFDLKDAHAQHGAVDRMLGK